MPLYDYKCRACGHQFEVLLLHGNTAPEQCPECAGAPVERVPSLFAVDTDGTRKASLTKARQAALPIERDKAIAHEEYVNKHHD